MNREKIFKNQAEYCVSWFLFQCDAYSFGKIAIYSEFIKNPYKKKVYN